MTEAKSEKCPETCMCLACREEIKKNSLELDREREELEYPQEDDGDSWTAALFQLRSHIDYSPKGE